MGIYFFTVSGIVLKKFFTIRVVQIGFPETEIITNWIWTVLELVCLEKSRGIIYVLVLQMPTNVCMWYGNRKARSTPLLPYSDKTLKQLHRCFVVL